MLSFCLVRPLERPGSHSRWPRTVSPESLSSHALKRERSGSHAASRPAVRADDAATTRGALDNIDCVIGCHALRICAGWPRGGVVTQRSAKPFTPVQFRAWPPSLSQDRLSSSQRKVNARGTGRWGRRTLSVLLPARASNPNPIALAVPWRRVVGSHGDLIGGCARHCTLASQPSRTNRTTGWGLTTAIPSDHASFLKHCHDLGQTRPTPCCRSISQATSTVSTRTSTVISHSRFRSRSCHRRRARTSPVASSS